MFTTATSGDWASPADPRKLSQASRPRPRRPLSSRLPRPAAPGYALGESGTRIGRTKPAKLRGRGGGGEQAHAPLLRSGALVPARIPAPRASLRHGNVPAHAPMCCSQPEVPGSQSQNPQRRQAVQISKP